MGQFGRLAAVLHASAAQVTCDRVPIRAGPHGSAAAPTMPPPPTIHSVRIAYGGIHPLYTGWQCMAIHTMKSLESTPAPTALPASVAGFSLTDAWSLDLPSRSSSSSLTASHDSEAHVQSFRHDRTRLRCQIANVPGPLCTAVIIVPTTVRNHSGLPHTLEHACFMGSKHHPHRGFLDTAALLSLSTGTNAWTDCDSTCYTITLAGTHALPHLLPVFLDHILNPTLTPASFTTEVYHVNGKGEEQGVVFCEMMARQESEADVLDLALRQAVYGPESTYAYECGGVTDHIRKLTMDMIKAYHREQYRADKVAVVVLGSNVDAHTVLAALDQAPALAHIPAANLPTLPFQKTHALAPPFPLPPTGTTKVVQFPSEDEDTGSIAFAWQGPTLLPPPNASADQVRDHQRLLVALDVLGRYLSDGTASPLHQALVECPDAPGSDVDVEIRMYERVMVTCTVSGVAFHGRADHVAREAANDVGQVEGSNADDEAMEVDGAEDGWSTETDEEDEADEGSSDEGGFDESDGSGDDDDMSVDSDHSGSNPETDWFTKAKLAALLRQTLESLASPSTPNSHLTLDRIQVAIHRYKLHLLAQLEDDPHDTLLTAWIPDLVHTTGTVRAPSHHVHDSVFTHLATLLTYPLTFWQSLIQTWFLAQAQVQVMAVPSSKLAAKLERTKQARVQTLRKKLGPRGLKAAAAKLQQAMAANKANVSAFQSSLPAPADPTRVPQLPYSDTLLSFPSASGGYMFPSVHLVHVPTSAFVQVKLFFHLPASLASSPSLAPSMLLMQELLFHLPTRDGTPWESNVEKLNQLTSTYSCAVGLGSDVFTASYLTESLVVQFTCTPDKLAEATRAVATNVLMPHWDLSGGMVQERVKTVAKNLASDVQDWKRDGSSVVGSVSGAVVGRACGLVDPYLSVFVQERVLKRVGKAKEEEMDGVVARLKEVHARVLLRPWFAQVASANAEQGVWNVVHEAWSQVAHQANLDGTKDQAVPPAFPFPRSPYMHAPGPVVILPIAGITASYCSLWTHCDLLSPPSSSSSVTPPHHPDYFPTLVLLDVLSRSEGPLFTAIRGPGLAYDASLHLATWTGTLAFDISEASDPLPCLRALFTVLDTIDVDALAMDQAKGALAFRYASARSSPACVAAEALRARLRGVGELTRVDAQFAEGVKRVTVEEVKRVAKGWVQRLKVPGERRLVVVVPKGKEDKVQRELVEQGVVCVEQGEGVEVVGWGEVARQVLGIDV